MIRIKDCTKIVNGVGVNPELQGSSIGNIPFFRNSDFSKIGNTDFLIKSESNFSFEEIKLNHFRTIPKNSLVFSKIGESIRKNHKKFTQQTSVIDNNLSAFLISKKINEQFFYWFLKTIDFGNCLLPSTIPVLDMDVIKNLIVPDINKAQQTAIANYLDTETSKLDRKISILEQKYQKLEEYKQSVIFETVTKGLDSNVQMKDSEIEWIGNIPSHWEVKRVKEVFNYLNKSDIPSGDGDVDGIYDFYVSGSKLKKVNKLNLNKKALLLPTGGNYMVHFPKNIPCAYSTDVLPLIPNSLLNIKYGYYFLISNQKYFNQEYFSGMGIKHLQREEFFNSTIVIPSKDEQENFVNYLENICSKVDKKKEIIKKQIELLKEYKQTIIYEAVTGKIELGELHA